MDLLYVEDERPPLGEDDISKAIFIGARQGRSGCHSYVALEDLTQACWLDFFDKPQKYLRYVERGNFNGLVKEMIRTSGQYAQKEKAAALGYRPEDLFFYSRKTLREVIPAVLKFWETGDHFEDVYPDRALWLDVVDALKTLGAAEQQIIHWAFHGDPGEDAGAGLVAQKLGVSESAASMRVGRVLDKLRESIGGSNPFPIRKSLSNAASQAMTRNQWDGEG